MGNLNFTLCGPSAVGQTTDFFDDVFMKTPGRRSGNLYVPGTVLVAVYQLVAVVSGNTRQRPTHGTG
jgi:hypothetical protein